MAMPALPFVAAFYAALTGLLCVVLSMLVVRQRMQTRISIGDGGVARLVRMARVFGNFAEYAALVLVLLALLEICGGPRWLVHALGACFIVGRVAHAYGCQHARHQCRPVGRHPLTLSPSSARARCGARGAESSLAAPVCAASGRSERADLPARRSARRWRRLASRPVISVC